MAGLCALLSAPSTTHAPGDRVLEELELETTPPDASFQEPERTGNLDLVLIIDTSKSMRGAGGTADIFGRVRTTAKDLVSELKEGDTVTLLVFADATRVYPTITLHGEAERRRFFELIDELDADGDWTYTAEALRQALVEADRLESTFEDHRQVLLILTDGLNDPPPGAREDPVSLAEVAEPYQGRPWYVYQVQYGAAVDTALADAIGENFPRGGTITDRAARGGIDSLRPVIQAADTAAERAGPATLEWSLSADALELRLEELDAPVSDTLEIELPAGLDAEAVEVRLSTDAVPESVRLEHSVTSVLGGLRVVVMARATEAVENQTHDATLALALAPGVEGFRASPREVAVRVRTALVPPTWPYWLGGILLAGLIGGLVLWAVHQRRARTLFGSLEYWPAEEPGSRRRVDELAAFGTSVSIGSSSIPLSGSGELATLTTSEVEGERLVTVKPTGGRLRFRDKAVPDLVLYSGDRFELDGWHFRYRGATGRRPRS